APPRPCVTLNLLHKEALLMLGELLGEASGKMAGVRVLPTEDQQIKVEVSFQGQGKVLGQEIGDVCTYWQTTRPGGELYGEGHLVMMTKDGGVGEWIGFGVGQPTGPPPAAHYAVAGHWDSAPAKMARLLGVATVIEYDADQNGNYHWKMWEWK